MTNACGGVWLLLTAVADALVRYVCDGGTSGAAAFDPARVWSEPTGSANGIGA